MNIVMSGKYRQVIDDTNHELEAMGQKFASDFEYRFVAFTTGERIRFIKKLRSVMKKSNCESFRFHTFGGNNTYLTQNQDVLSWFEAAARKAVKTIFPKERCFVVTQTSVTIAEYDDGQSLFSEYIYEL